MAELIEITNNRMGKNFEETIKWYDRNAVRYAQATHKHAIDYQIEEFCDLLGPGDLVLDAGCGAGRDSKLLCDKGIVVVGLDISTGLINVARSKYPQIEFVHGDFLDLEFPNNYFNGIWSHASLIHLEKVRDTEQALFEFHRVLKSDGILHILVKKKLGKEDTKILEDNSCVYHGFFRYFSPNEINDLVDSCGFAILKTETYKETDHIPDGREDVSWIRILAQKV